MWVAVLALVAVLGAIFVLARQGVKETGDAAYRVEQWLVRLVPPTGTGSKGEPTWCGLTIRRLAHVAEYAALGLVAALVCQGLGASLVLCLVASLADEVHKNFVPGRHFDAKDLVLDALGYVPVACVVSLVLVLVR